MPDYSLGRAHGKIEIGYDGSGADKAARDLDRVAESSASADESLSKTQKTLGDTDGQMRSSGTSAEGYAARLRDVRQASDDVEAAERRYKAALLDSESSTEDIEDALSRLEDARKRHKTAIDSERDAHRALFGEMRSGRQVLQDAAGDLDQFGDAARRSSAMLLALVKDIAGLEAAVGKIGAVTLGAGALGGLAGLAGGVGIQGIVEVADAAKQLSGALGLLPAVIGGVGVVTATLGVAFQGVDSALKDMLADDPKKFLEDIKNMGPAAAQAMLQVAQFRDQFKLGGAAVQDSFFSKIAADIAPLIQTWLPALVSAGSQIAGVLGDAAHELAGLLQQPVLMQQFQSFIANVSAGLQALQPAMVPLLNIFQELAVVGSSLFQQIGGQITHMLDFFAQLVDKMAASGQLRAWIQEGVDGFGRLINIAYLLGSAFGNVMDIAEKFGGGGLIAWLEQLSSQLNNWTQSAEGRKALTDFFTLLRQATDAFLPMIQPLANGLMSIGQAFLQLGVATAPGWQQFFTMFAQSMATLGPQIATMGPAINQFLYNMGVALVNLVNQVGPQLPELFSTMSNAFSTLLPQLGPLTNLFIQLIEDVGPQLPALFASVTQSLNNLIPLMPTITGLIGNFVSVLTFFNNFNHMPEFLKGLIDGINNLGDAIKDLPTTIGHVVDAIGTFFDALGHKGVDWGKALVKGLIDGMLDGSGLGALSDAANTIVDHIASWFQHSPAKQGPFSGSGYTLIRGQQMVKDMAAGMVSAQSAVENAAKSTAAAASTALGGAAGGAPAAGGADVVAGALLPPNIAGADTSILSAYLRHQFPDNNGLKGLAKDMGRMLQAAQSGFNLLSQHVIDPMFQVLGMIPGLNNQRWTKMSPEQIAAQQQEELQRKALEGNKKQGPSWGDVFGPGAPGATPGGGATPLGVTASSSKEQIQQAIIAAGRARGLNDAAIQTALAVAAAESGFNPTISGGVQGSAGLVSGLFQQSPSSGWGTLEQVNDPNYAINAFYDAFAKQLAQSPSNPLLAAVLTQNPQLGSGAQGSAYWNAVSAQLGLGGQLLSQLGPGVKNGPTWQQVTGTTTPAAMPGGTYGLPGGTDTGGYGTGSAKTFPEWVMAVAARFGVKPSTYAGHQESDRNEPGYAPNPQHLNRGIDWSGTVEQMQAFANYLATVPQDLEQVIFRNPNTGQAVTIAGGKPAPVGYYDEATLAEHQNHVHTRQSAPIPLPDGSVLLPSQPAVGSALGTGPSGGLMMADGKTIDQLLDTSQQNLSVNDQLLQAYLQGNPALAAQIDAARTPGASDDQVLTGLNSITSTIDTLKRQDAVGNKNTIQALQSTQSQIAQGAGFQQGPSALQTAQSAVGGVTSAISGAFQVAQSYLDALAATQDIADRLVYGVRNTEDVNKLIDDYQKWITFAANVASEVGTVLSAVGSFTGGSDFGGTAAAGQAASLISGLLQGVNAAIDFGQEIYHIAGTYVGRFLSYLTAGLGGTPLMGDVRFLLNKNTGQLITYSEDNPGNKNTLNVPSWLNQTYDYGGGSNPNPQVNTQWNIYAGPGQSPGEMLNEVNWMYQTAGTDGALAPANF